jgi:hypothetical protein
MGGRSDDELREVVETLEALAARRDFPAGGERELLAERLIAALRAGVEALARLSGAGAVGPARDPPEVRPRAVVEGGVAGLVGGLDRGLPKLEDELRRLGPSLEDVAARLGSGLVHGVAAGLETRGPQLARSAADLASGLVAQLGSRLRRTARDALARTAPRRTALAATGAGAVLALAVAAVLRRRG